MNPLISFLLIFFINFISQTQLLGQGLPTETSNVFSGSGNCVLCHEAQSNNDALKDINGNDIGFHA